MVAYVPSAGRGLPRGVVGALTAVAVTASVVGAAGVGVATAGTAPAPTCPDTVVLASRGSEENDRYAPLTEGADGWEGASLHRFFTYALSVHPDLFDGDVRLTAIDPAHYPARLPLPGPGEEITLPALADGGAAFIDSMARGVPGCRDQVRDWETSTGCAPDYVTVGYSQGQIPLLAVQHHLGGEGRLRGALAFGNPLQKVPGPVPGFPAGTPALSTCAPDDVVCDTSPRSVFLALTDEDDAGVHADYFKDAVAGNPGDADRRAADALADMLH